MVDRPPLADYVLDIDSGRNALQWNSVNHGTENNPITD